MKSILIFGAGKIGRGFIGRLFYDGGYDLYFVDNNRDTVELLNTEKQFRVQVAGKPEMTRYIPVSGSFHISDHQGMRKVFEKVDLFITAVGAPNMLGMTDVIKELLMKRDHSLPVNWLICENAYRPSVLIKERLLENAGNDFRDFVTNKLGLVETQILCSVMLPDDLILQQEPLALKTQDWSVLPFDKDAYKGAIPVFPGLMPKKHFENELVRKLFTFNGTNGPISYVGWLNGYQFLHEAANAPELNGFIEEIQSESKFGLIGEYGFDPEEQDRFHLLALTKYKDETLEDLIERNARDLRKKLGINERLVGPALLCLKHGRKPYAYATATAAAIRYEGSTDEGSLEVRTSLAQNGLLTTLCRYTGLPEDHPFIDMVIQADQNELFAFSK
ncbi:hypothetical protein [Chitinophaga sp. MM2321]|uniref:mannitol dehydrogenase family protein n=1 Tax=Chitinophaga sp. MM2321 TaxID=3137178 RepID=UPI0032D57B0C